MIPCPVDRDNIVPLSNAMTSMFLAHLASVSLTSVILSASRLSSASNLSPRLLSSISFSSCSSFSLSMAMISSLNSIFTASISWSLLFIASAMEVSLRCREANLASKSLISSCQNNAYWHYMNFDFI